MHDNMLLYPTPTLIWVTFTSIVFPLDSPPFCSNGVVGGGGENASKEEGEEEGGGGEEGIRGIILPKSNASARQRRRVL